MSADLMTVEYGWPVGMPTCRPMGAGLHEVRTDITDGRIARVLFCVNDNKLILLHGFIKKAQKTPKQDLQLGRDRLLMTVLRGAKMTKVKAVTGSSLEDLFEETGELVEVNTVAIKRVVAWEIRQKMQHENITKSAMAELMQTSRSALDRLLDPTNTSVTLNTLDHAARVIGKRLHVELREG